MKKLSRIIAAVILLAAFFALSGCKKNDYEEFEGFYFDTIVNVRVYNAEDEIIDGLIRLCMDYDLMFDKNTSGSDVWRMNEAAGQPTVVSDATAEIVRLAQEYSKLSQGRFDITCGAVTSLWDFKSENPSIPDEQSIAAALQTVGSEKISINGNEITLQEGTEIDLGAIAKGYIADRLTDYLKENGAQNAVINLGGNIVVVGDKFGEGYRVGIRSPFDSGYIDSVTVSDCSIVSAGTYERGFELNGEYYHHILDLNTGMPAKTGLAAVTVITETSVEGDALATILFLCGAEEGLRLAESLSGVEAIFITEEGEVIKTSGLAQE